MRERTRIAHGESKAEKGAAEVASRAMHRGPPRGPDLTTSTDDGARSLSAAGRAHFEPMVGASLAHAKIRVDAAADRATELAHAEALTHRDSIYIPRARFAPDTAQGHALLAHELAHVPHAAADPTTVFRQPKPHYPSEDEQKELEKVLGRQLQVVPVEPAPDAAPDAPKPATKNVDIGKTLTDDQVRAMATSLVPVFEQALSQFPTTGTPTTTTGSAKEAVSDARRALAAINKEFGAYLDSKVAITDDTSLDTPQLAANHEVSVIYGWDPAEPQTFASEVILHWCPACTAALRPYAATTQAEIRSALHDKVMGDPALANKVEIAAKHAVGGSHAPETHKIRITPYGLTPYADSVHELLHEFTHPAFARAFGQDMTEVFTQYFTEEIAPTPPPKPGDKTFTRGYDLSRIHAMLDAMTGGPLSYQGDSPEESLRLAYFKGRLDLIGFRGTEVEETAVKAAGGVVWDAATAAQELKERNARMLAAQSPHANQLGVGVYFPLGGGSMLGMRYARVLHTRNPPYASSQLYLEGQVLGTLTSDPRRVGASVGLGFERQEPHYYVGAGGRAVATGALGGELDPQVAAEPFFAVGLRAMHYVRVGVEGFALIPVPAVKSTTVGATVTLGVEW